jgi:hypothetical protein
MEIGSYIVEGRWREIKHLPLVYLISERLMTNFHEEPTKKKSEIIGFLDMNSGKILMMT